MPDVSTTVPVVIALVGGLLVAGAWHVWYAAGLARVFAALDVPRWRAWVPLLNEAELFRLGRVDPVRVALFLVPLVALYAFVLKFVAAGRIGDRYRRGTGTTLLAVLLPPVWAMILSSAQPVEDVVGDEDEDDDDAIVLVSGRPEAYAGASLEAPSLGTPSLAIAQAAPAASDASAPGAPAAAPGATQWLGTSPPPPAAAAAPVALPAPVPPAPLPASLPPAAVPPVSSVPRAAPPRTAPPTPPVSSVPVSPAAAEVPVSRRSRRPADPGAAAADLERTTVTARSTAAEIVLPSGAVVAITAPTVVLGRRPSGSDAATQYIAVSDDTRTVSKQHATLSWTDAGWTITDLGSTNGVTLVSADGAEQRLAPQASASVSGRFFLGDAALELRSSL